jgi:hypothetical protein
LWLALAAHARAYKVQVTDSGAKVRWYSADVELSLSPELEAYFADMPMPRLMSEAAEAWAGLPGAPIVHITSGTRDELGFHEQQNRNGVYLVHDWKLFPDALAVTVATFESRTGKLVDADVLVNANFSYSWLSGDGEPTDRYDLLSVMTHELGHVLGLGDAPDSPGATMWPTVNPGDTYQRDIDADDEEGVEQAYRTREVTETLARSGCGGASVLRPRSGPQTRAGDEVLVMCALWIALWLWSRERALRTPERYGIVLGGVLLFGGLFAPSPSASPAPDQLGDLSLMSPVPQVDPDAQGRLGAFVKGAERLIVGRASHTHAQRRGGLIFTQFVVRGALSSAELEFPGGSLGGVTQVVSGQTPPQDGDLLLVALHKQGPHGWAHLRAGRLVGGTLELGSSLDWH